jgi:sugar phosphate isomerase/epimerase
MIDARVAGGPSALNRRRFLGLAGATIAGAGLSGLSFGASPALAAESQLATETVRAGKLGVQMWTCLGSWEADAPETLDLLAQMGYTYIEWAFMPPTLTPQILRKALDDTGLWCNGGHGTSAYPYNDANWKKYVQDQLVIGSRYLGANTNFPSTKSDCMKYVEAVYKANDVARSMGHKGFQYNHLESAAWNKLSDKPDTYAWEFIVENTSHDVWNVELDTLHALQPLGSMDLVLHYIRKHPGRMPFFHVKDGGYKSVYLPDGTAVSPGDQPSEFGMGKFGSADPSDPENRPHAGFQDVFTAARETQDWKEVLLIAESDGSMATCYDYTYLAFDGLEGLKFDYVRPTWDEKKDR